MVCGDPSADNSSITAQNFGDYWCPEEFKRDGAQEICIPQEDLCDTGINNNADCADISSGSTDPYYQAYHDRCVEDTGSKGAYNQLCCLEAQFNNFQVYSLGGSSEYIKIY